MGDLLRRAAAAARDRPAAIRKAARSALRRGAWVWSRRPPAPRAAAILFVVAAGVLAAWAILAQARLPARLPTALDWAAARALVESDARPGDAVALSPPWAERARAIFPSSIAVLAQPRYAGEDLVGVRRIWMVSLPRTPRFSWNAETDLLERAARTEEPARLGGIEVTRYDVAAPTLPLAFLPDRLGSARVALGEEPCRREAAGRFVCGEGAAEVERTVREIGGVPRPCLSAAAPGSLAAPLVIEFPATRIGRMLHGHAGRPGDAGAPLRVALQLDGEEVGAAEIASAGWTPFRIDMARAAGQARSLSLVLTGGGPLEVCLDAVVLR